MKQNLFYCSSLSTESREQPIGTASIGNSWLLLEYCEPWESKAFEESKLPKEVKHHLTRALKSVPRSRLLLIKQDQPADHPMLFIVRTSESESSIVKYELTNYEQLLDFDLAATLKGETLAGFQVCSGPLFLVCTHGKRDKCCAKFGFATYKAIRDYAGADSVWQSSHVGGDRFAANVICFPDGLFYGHVTEATTPQLVSSYREGKLLLNNLRGRACYERPIQVAEYFARSQSGLIGINDLKFSEYETIKSNYFRVKFLSHNTSHEVYITSELSKFENPMTCHSEEKRRVVQYSLNDYRLASNE